MDARPLHLSAGLNALAALAPSMEELSTTYIASTNLSSCASDKDDSDILPSLLLMGEVACVAARTPRAWKNGSFSAAMLIADDTCSQRQSWRRSLPRQKLLPTRRMLVQRSRFNPVSSSLANEDESWVDPKELLQRRARSRQGSITGEKRQWMLPHAPSKYFLCVAQHVRACVQTFRQGMVDTYGLLLCMHSNQTTDALAVLLYMSS